jgi:hypothetical protein
MFIPDPDLDFYQSRIPDPGVKKASDPGSGSALFESLKRNQLDDADLGIICIFSRLYLMLW